MTLKQQLMWGIIAVLLFFGVFFVLFHVSSNALDHFINAELTPDMDSVKLLDQVVNRWIKISETLNSIENTDSSEVADIPLPLIPDEQIRQFEASFQRLSTFELGSEQGKNLEKIISLAGAFCQTERMYERLIEKHARLSKIHAQKTTDASAAVFRKTTDLLQKFKVMREDAIKLFHDSVFQNSPNNTSELMLKISRVEKDLQQISDDISRFGRKSSGSFAEASDKTDLAERIHKRFNAVLALLDRLQDESHNAIQKRILMQIQNTVHDSKKSFLEWRDSFAAPDSEIIELDQEMDDLELKLRELKKEGLRLAVIETDRVWMRITNTSQNLLKRNRSDVETSKAMLYLAFALGIAALLIYPKRVAGPLQNLSLQIKDFQLGTRISPAQFSGTTEIETLGESFSGMAARLNTEVGLNSTYISAISRIGEVYVSLGESSTFDHSGREFGLEKALNKILDELMQGLPGVDIAKVMVLKTQPGPAKTKEFIRLGETKFSSTFSESGEYKEYCKSVAGAPNADTGVISEKEIPIEEGLTGWLFGPDAPPTDASGEGKDTWVKNIPLVSIKSNPILMQRNFEKGLNGCLHAIRLMRELTVSDPDSEYSTPDCMGILFMYFSNPLTHLSQQDLLFAKIMARQMAMVIEGEELLKVREKQRKTQYQLEMAAQIQESLLPRKVPPIDGLTVSHLNKPAFEVGGDYYDFFPLSETRFGFVVADASGKNVPAALMMTVFKTTLASMSLQKLSAGEVLKRANKIIMKNMALEDRFITAMYVIIDVETNSVELACAGHHPALVVSGKGFELSIAEWTSQGVPLGIMEMEYATSHFKIKPKDLLLVYTDGVIEARNMEGREYEISGLKRFLARPRAQNPAHALWEDVARFMGEANQHDDVTIVAVEYLGKTK